MTLNIYLRDLLHQFQDDWQTCPDTVMYYTFQFQTPSFIKHFWPYKNTRRSELAYYLKLNRLHSEALIRDAWLLSLSQKFPLKELHREAPDFWSQVIWSLVSSSLAFWACKIQGSTPHFDPLAGAKFVHPLFVSLLVIVRHGFFAPVNCFSEVFTRHRQIHFLPLDCADFLCCFPCYESSHAHHSCVPAINIIFNSWWIKWFFLQFLPAHVANVASRISF